MVTSQPEAVIRRFLQARRRGLFSHDELTRLLTADAEYTEVVNGERWTIIGAMAISETLQAYWARDGEEQSMSIIRHAATDDGGFVGHWSRRVGERDVYGRDTFTMRDGLICRIEVEEFEEARMPAPFLQRR